MLFISEILTQYDVKNDTLQPKKEHKHSSHYASNAEKAYNLAYLYLF